MYILLWNTKSSSEILLDFLIVIVILLSWDDTQIMPIDEIYYHDLSEFNIFS